MLSQKPHSMHLMRHSNIRVGGQRTGASVQSPNQRLTLEDKTGLTLKTRPDPSKQWPIKSAHFPHIPVDNGRGHWRGLEELDVCIRVAVEHHTRVEDVLRVKHLLELPHELVGLAIGRGERAPASHVGLSR